MNINELIKEREERTSKVFKDCGVFFAFDNDQFNESKTPKADGEKYVSIGGGGYLPKSYLAKLDEGFAAIEIWFKQQTKEAKIRDSHIKYELGNHEAYYTGNITDTLEALGDDYTREDVLKVYKANYKKYCEGQNM